MKKYGKRLVSFLLAVTLILGMIPPVTVESKAVSTGFEGKTVSILSHSISTYAGVSNNAKYNSTIGNNDVYYTEGRHGVYLKDTWWQQTIDALGMKLLVNNSWSGSCVFQPRKGEASIGYGDRAVNLHNDRTGEEPDIIFIYLGCNDFAYYKDSFGTAADVNDDALIMDDGDGTFTYAVPETACEAYAIMLHKVRSRYPGAQIYCMTSTARRAEDYTGDSYPDAGQPTEYMAQLQIIAKRFGFPVIDLGNAIPKDVEIFDKYMGDQRAHPNALGMDQITNAVLTAMLGEKSEICHVTAQMGAVAEKAVLLGGSYSATVAQQVGYSIQVTMGGKDITAEAYRDGKITIAEVTGDIAVTVDRQPAEFSWKFTDNELVSVGSSENPLKKLSGTVTDGVLNDGRYQLTTSVVLKHNLPWEIEWKCAEDWRGLLLSSDPAQTKDMVYLARVNGGQLCFGTWTGKQYDNYGIDISNLDAQAHTYRLENRIAADGSNMVWLYVDGEEIGPMNHYFVGSRDQNKTSDWISGKDFTLSYIGIESHTLRNCRLEYLTVRENGHTHDYKPTITAPICTEKGDTTYTCTCGDSYVDDYQEAAGHSYVNGICTGCGAEDPDAVKLYNYRWEMQNNTLVSVTANGNTGNSLTLDSGSITGGTLKNIRYSLNQAVKLYHDEPWVVEWRSSGHWEGMLLASNADTSVSGTTYLFRFASMNFLALGEHTNTWDNYGLIHEIDMTVPHLFRLENRIDEDGTNTVYLLVDGVEIDAMYHYYNSGTNQNKIVNWANGRDIVFGNIGTTSHPIRDMKLEYLQIWERGHIHSYQSNVTVPTCTKKGYTTYTCECGSSYVGDYVDAKAHSYVNGSCTVCGAVASNPYAGKTIACIGDSITYGVGVTRDETDYVKLLADRLEMNYIRLGASGTTLSTDGSRTCNIDKLNESKLQGADVVTIAMGINDFCAAGEGYYELGDIDSTDSSTIYGAVRMWCEQIVELRKTDSLKNTEFYFVTPLITSWNNSVTSARNWDQSKVNIHGYTLRDLCNAIIEVAALYDVAVIDMNLISGLYYVSAEDNNIDVFGGDGVHPGSEGHAMMAAALEDVLLGHDLLDDHDHSYGSWITTTYPDCEGGEEKRVCGVCHATESRKLDGTGHSYENGICADCGAEHPELADYSGKVISIMGDSISTFAGYIPVADGFNMEHLARYPQDNLLTDVNETWWMQVVAALDAKLGINDSWRGATLSGGAPVTTGTTGENAAMSNLIRIQNLGSNGTPDVILLYGGTNDLAHVSKVGTFDPATAPTQVDLTTKKWDNLADGFVHTLLRMRYYYPDAVIVAMLPTYTASYYSDEKLAQGNAVMAAICEHYGILYVDLRESGVTAEHLPDGIHPGEEGMDLITTAVVDALLEQCDIQSGENVVYPVSQNLTNVKASLGHWKGVSAGKPFHETLTGDDLTVTVTMGGEDVTDQVYADGVIFIEKVTGALVITAKGVFNVDGHLQQLPEKAYNTTNLWAVLEHDEEYYAANGWTVHATGKVRSVTVPVTAGDRIWATSFGAAGTNGGSIDGIRVTFFSEEGLLISMTADKVYEEFGKNGYLTVPEDAVAVSVPMWNENGAEMYILTLPAIPSEENVHLSQKAQLQPDGSFTFTLEIQASEKVALYGDAVIRYVLNQGFVMTGNGTVRVMRISEAMENALLNESMEEAKDLTVVVNEGILDVTGFDLSKEYISDEHSGSKLVITISGVEATEDVIWGENMDISTADSGIWDEGVMAVAFAKSSACFRENVYVMDYAQKLTLNEEGVLHLSADSMGCFADANVQLKMRYGTAAIENGAVVYIPGTMRWDGYDRFYAFAKQEEAYQWTKVAVVPANNVYYEDSFVAASAENAANGAGIYYTNGTKPEDVAQEVWDTWYGQWECVSDNKTGNSVEDASDVHGWIEDLAEQTGFTGGSAHLVQAILGQKQDGIPKATFTFTGTGVDIYSFTNNTTGTVLVQVSDVKGTYPSSYYIVDTGANTVAGYYQVPTISFAGKGYSTYQVTIMVTTAAAGQNRFAFYLDGIRVYNPLAEDAKDETVEDAYGDEMQAVFGSVRQMLLDAGSFTGTTGEGSGFVFLDQMPDSEKAGNTNVIGIYQIYGPKNEVYLAKGQAIAFKVDEKLYSRVQVGLKSLTGEEVQAVVSYFDEETEAAAQGLVSISHTADLYYELMPMDGYVVIRNTSDAILAVTKVKLMASGEPEQISMQVEKISQAEVLAAVEEFDELPVMAYSLRSFRPDVEITVPGTSAEDVAAAQLRALVEKLFGSVRQWLEK